MLRTQLVPINMKIFVFSQDPEILHCTFILFGTYFHITYGITISWVATENKVVCTPVGENVCLLSAQREVLIFLFSCTEKSYISQ